MNQKLQSLQTSIGASFQNSVPISFDNDIQAIKAAEKGVALCDRSHWGLIEISGDDRLRFLHNQSTNNFNILQPGQGCETVFVTPTALSLIHI